MIVLVELIQKLITAPLADQIIKTLQNWMAELYWWYDNHVYP